MISVVRTIRARKKYLNKEKIYDAGYYGSYDSNSFLILMKRTRNNPKWSTLLIGDIEAPQNSTYKIPVKWSYFENSDPYFPEKVSPTSKDSKGNWTENEEYVVRTITYY